MLTHDTNEPMGSGGTGAGTNESADTDRDGTRVELWCEAARTGGANEFDRVAERLRRLADRGDVDAAAVETWDRYVDVSGGFVRDDVTEETRDRLARLREWTWRRREGGTTRGDTRPAGRGRLGPAVELYRVPRAALVEFENGVVTNVTFADEHTGCLTERLKTLAERERSESVSESASPPTSADRGSGRDRSRERERERMRS
ncbi:hypothetical protein C474_18329 [Halogeometricum pallidum JCM 14848]|uniref:Uncharacterized protein n=1 Tax=Halogeometricum pallidum JCM 14848 TaxID=1227487 RepID=M0CVT3_HALPD|nr:HTH domain-containing protein [Halogeometricum pallidum]ELZ27330.1 hypothetical protein C474_18329 [Halogeometricum pallidum JCM 14848]